MIREIIHVNVNVTDIERSLAFYQKLGFQVMHVFGDRPTEDPTQGMDFHGGRVRGVVLSLGDHPRAATKIELLEWVRPAAEPQPERPGHQAGVSRIAMRVKGLREMVERLQAEGIELEGEVLELEIMGAKCFALLRDPDGTLLELIEF